MIDFFSDHAVLFALICSFVAIGYGIGLTVWLLRQPAGDERMQEIARAIQAGRPLAVPGGDEVQNVAVLEAIVESARKGAPVSIPA